MIASILVLFGTAAVFIIGRSGGVAVSANPVETNDIVTNNHSTNETAFNNDSNPTVAVVAGVTRETKDNRRQDALIDAAIARQAPALATGQWINSEPTTLAKLRGQVVLVDFWTYGCYNCINTLPALKSYRANYGDKGLTILGVETPETEGEKSFENLAQAVKKRGIEYAVVTDYQSDSWRAFEIEAWPTVIILDKKGRLRYTHVGEGSYDVQEKVIQTLLAEKDEEAALGSDKENKGEQTAVFAGGCFWGLEAVFEHIKGVKDVKSGYSGGAREKADYESVSTGETGHAESVKITFDPAQVSYEQLLKVFFAVAHNPTELNRQGPDTGTQYRSAIFYANAEQKRLSENYIAALTNAKTYPAPIVTQVVALNAFYPAEDYHQDYLAHHPTQPYIMINDQPKVENLQKQFPALYVSK